jgi:hypothetical protein
MKVGSIVECIDNSKFENKVKLKTTYTVKQIIPEGQLVYKNGNLIVVATMTGIRLEEVDGTITVFSVPIDIPFPMVNFRELLPPMENIEELINENLQPEKVFA